MLDINPFKVDLSVSGFIIAAIVFECSLAKHTANKLFRFSKVREVLWGVLGVV